MDVLSQTEIQSLLDGSQSGLYSKLRNCSLAVLNTGNEIDDGKRLLEEYASFDIEVVQEERGIKLKLKNAPLAAFVDGKMIKGINEHLFSVLRDVIYSHNSANLSCQNIVETSNGITDSVFHILRNTHVLQPTTRLKLVVCWGGHSISRTEYDYSKDVGYQLGLRGLNICTGCGPGAMKGPMKGATIGHAKQRNRNGQYLGITEPGIIAAEAPNPIVNNLIIMPDIEKRLEAFTRLAHGIIVFPGGVGTVEEILYLLGILLHPENQELPFPMILTGPESSRDYFDHLDHFIGETLGPKAQACYTIIVNDPQQVAKSLLDGIKVVRNFRANAGDAFYFNWLLKITESFQQPFEPTHENMRNMEIDSDMERHELAANLRRVFSGIVAGNVKDSGIRAIEEHGLFEIAGDKKIMSPMDDLLKIFVEQHRMKLPGAKYSPCYRVIS